MSGTERRQRSRLVGLRLLPDEHDRLLAAAKARRVSISDLLRERVSDLIEPTRARSGAR